MTTSVTRQWPDDFLPCERAEYERWAQQPNQHLLPRADPRYPPLLREIPDAPPLLFVRGSTDVLSLPQLAIVGSRRPTVDGRKNARRFARDICSAGYLVTSGLALGIDAEAHRGALECGARTIAVLGTGLDNIYPPCHASLAAQIAEQGALVSEFPPTELSYPGNFPQRNRIISGLAHGVLVVEAAQQSGSLITARCAGEQGRGVYAVPGSIHNVFARGCHRLIRQGAKLVESIDDILEENPALVQWERQRETTQVPARPALSGPLQQVLEQIAQDPVSVDSLLLRTGRELPELYASLMQLELGGYIVNRADGYVLSTP